MAVPFTTYLHPERYKHSTSGKTAIFTHPRSKIDLGMNRRTCAFTPHDMRSRLNGCDIERYFVLSPKSNKAWLCIHATNMPRVNGMQSTYTSVSGIRCIHASMSNSGAQPHTRVNVTWTESVGRVRGGFEHITTLWSWRVASSPKCARFPGTLGTSFSAQSVRGSHLLLTPAKSSDRRDDDRASFLRTGLVCIQQCKHGPLD